MEDVEDVKEIGELKDARDRPTKQTPWGKRKSTGIVAVIVMW